MMIAHKYIHLNYVGLLCYKYYTKYTNKNNKYLFKFSWYSSFIIDFHTKDISLVWDWPKHGLRQTETGVGTGHLSAEHRCAPVLMKPVPCHWKYISLT